VKLNHPEAELFIPDGIDEEGALARTTHLAIGAHQDDLEIMAVHGILQCYRQPDSWFTGVVVTDGRGAPRAHDYVGISNDDLAQVRNREQRNAAMVGEYAAQFMLGWPSVAVKDAKHGGVVEDLVSIITATRPRVVYTHNLADKHDTHIGVALRVVAALRASAPELRPRFVYGCEVWRDLDWLLDEDKVPLDAGGRDSLLNALIGCFDSQVSGGKRYDLAAAGRRMAHATFNASHQTDAATALVYAMDLTPLVDDPTLSPRDHVARYLQRFAGDVIARVAQFS
jgi:LmbE family N-acetylglucosaminyl deacetylase